MKTKLLSILFFTATITWGQSIPTFHGVDNSSFALLTTATPLDHSAAGANQTWTFSNFVFFGSVFYNYFAPTAAETTSYPGTTEVIVGNSPNGTTRMYTKTTAGNVLSITGLTGTDLNINFSSNNATLGAFPMAYGFTNTDNVSGNYTYTTYSGTFSGTLVTTVDAYGTLTLTDPAYAYSGSVVRLKTVLNISLNYGIFTNVGTVTQTSYIYYDTAGSFFNNPIFRSITTAAVVPLLSIDQTETSLEKFSAVLGVADNAMTTLWIKNPVGNNIEINSSAPIEQANIAIVDMLGKTVYSIKNQTVNGLLEIPVTLNKGMYVITIANDNGSISKKIVKN